MRKILRPIIFWILTIGSHIWIIFELFFKHNILQSVIALLIFFIMIHFLYLDIYQKNQKKIGVIIVIITVIEVIIANFFGNWVMLIGLIIMNWTAFYISTILEKVANESILFKSTEYFLSTWYVFTLGMTIAYSFFIVGIYNKFPFSCEDLNKNASKVVETVLNPFNISLPKDENTSSFFKETKVKDILSVGKMLNIESEVKGITPLENFKKWKDEFITKTLNENQELNEWICEYSLNKLNTKMKNTDFQIGVIILMVTISYPFLRIAIQIMAYIWLILFRTIKKCKGYSIEKEIREIEKIQ